MRVCFAIVFAMVAGVAEAGSLHLTSTDVADGETMHIEQVMNSYGCTGGNISPDLTWSGTPEGTGSLAVTMHDPDAPKPGGFRHWLLFNLPPTTTGLSEGAGAEGSQLLPPGAMQGLNDANVRAYSGACPPKGGTAHRYVITLWALPEVLPAKAGASAQSLRQYLTTPLAEATITALYGR